MIGRGKLRVPALLAAILASVAFLAACSEDEESADGSAGGAAGEPIVLGVVSQEQELVQFPEVAQVAEAFGEYVNEERGGINGRPLEVDVCESGDRAESTQACVQEFVNNEDVVGVVLGTVDTVTARRILVPAGVPAVSFFVDLDDARTEGFYTLDAGSIGQGFLLGKHLAQNLEAEEVSLICIDDPNFEVICDQTEEGIRLQGIEIRERVAVAADSTDYTGPVTALEADQVDRVVAVMFGEQCLPLAQTLDQLEIETTVIGPDICLSENVIDSGLVEGWTIVNNSSIGEEGSDDPDVIEAQRILSEYGNDVTLFGLTGNIFADMWVFADVLESLGDDISRETMNAALSEYDAEVPTYGRVTCPGPGEWVGQCHPFGVMETIEDGVFVPTSEFLEVTEEFANHEV